jgi:hypothetical protein
LFVIICKLLALYKISQMLTPLSHDRRECGRGVGGEVDRVLRRQLGRE